MSTPTITKLNKDDRNKLSFTIENVDRSIINAIRRTLLKDIPVFVFDTRHEHCIIDTNTTRFTNEIIKQRLDCIPLFINDMEFPYDQYTVSLNKKNTENHITYVTSQDFKITYNLNGDTLKTEAVEKIFPKSPITNMYIDIVRLRPKISDDLDGEELNLTCKLKKSSAKVNSSYNVVTKVAFNNTIDINKSKEAWEVAKKTITENIELEKKNWNIFNAQRYTIDNSFDFTVESIGIYSCVDLMTLSCKFIIRDLNLFLEKLGKQEIKINANNNHFENGYDIIIDYNEITLGYLLQYILIHLNFKKDISYVGFNKPHPHDSYGILRIQLINDDKDQISLILKKSIDKLTEILNTIQHNF